MKKLVSITAAVTILAVASLASAASIKGPVTKITPNADGSYTTVIKDEATKKDVVVEVADDLTKDKLSGKKIVVDDEVKVKFDEKNGKNISAKFLKAAGC
ncbi:hypothetical protein SAMN02745119_00988 [Trichlorobacter thiogenes]|uniref:DUF5666 domain-containing protein n=1 Tax=Trichlorobacter thiogenes TaxID=115783 RepID=A0A1T4LPC9_9BACT|nr:hypothetical protein [Trichlorobacter thiogenes]SJZ56555.1 hypothetical protein SAMN02745119_00988 [Trichlorobacter thiogenes]